MLGDSSTIYTHPHVLPWKQGPFTVEMYAKDSLTKFDRRLDYPWNIQTARSAERVVSRLNRLYDELPLNLKGIIRITSGYRPGKYNERAGGAQNSKHITCEAVDLANPSNALGLWVLEHLDLMEKIGFWIEDPEATRKTNHLHLQICPPASGRRVFLP